MRMTKGLGALTEKQNVPCSYVYSVQVPDTTAFLTTIKVMNEITRERQDFLHECTFYISDRQTLSSVIELER